MGVHKSLHWLTHSRLCRLMLSFLDLRPTYSTRPLWRVISLFITSILLLILRFLVLPTTGKENNISHVTVSLSNPFSAPLQITKISSTVTSFGILLGSIEQDISFQSSPKSSTESPVLNFDLNFDPSALFTVTRALAVEVGEDVAPLDSIVQLGGFHYLPITQPESNQVRKRQGDLFSWVFAAHI